jgi:molybdopterin-guanine dinucleotide biosynthesis protein A
MTRIYRLAPPAVPGLSGRARSARPAAAGDLELSCDTDGGLHPTAAVLLAAGEGKRMRSALPKVMHPIGGVTLLGHAAAAVATLQPEHLAVVVGHGREQVSAEVEALGGQLGRTFVTAVQEKQLGTGHAVRCGLEALPGGLAGAVVVTYADVPLLDAAPYEAIAAAAGGLPSRFSPPSSPIRPGTAGWCAGRAARSPASSGTATPRRSSG